MYTHTSPHLCFNKCSSHINHNTLSTKEKDQPIIVNRVKIKFKKANKDMRMCEWDIDFRGEQTEKQGKEHRHCRVNTF